MIGDAFTSNHKRTYRLYREEGLSDPFESAETGTGLALSGRSP